MRGKAASGGRRTRPKSRACHPGLRLLALCVAAAGSPAVDAARAAGVRAASVPAGMTVLGFQMEGSPPRLIDRSEHALTQVGVAGVVVDASGRVSAPDAAAVRQLRRAHADGLPAVLLVQNWSARLGDFSERLAHRLLASPTAIDAAASTLAHYVTGQGWNGVSVDLESLAPRDRTGLSALVAALRSDLPPTAQLSVCLQAQTTTVGYSQDGYDLAALAAESTQLVLMTYDDHGPWENTPGPIGPLYWQRAAVRALTRIVAPAHVLLGAADYGYGWRAHANVSLNVSQARALVRRWHAHARWVRSAGEWTARLADGSTLWWSDRRSVALRLALARALGLGGVAVWSLGTGDPIHSR